MFAVGIIVKQQRVWVSEEFSFSCTTLVRLPELPRTFCLLNCKKEALTRWNSTLSYVFSLSNSIHQISALSINFSASLESSQCSFELIITKRNLSALIEKFPVFKESIFKTHLMTLNFCLIRRPVWSLIHRVK